MPGGFYFSRRSDIDEFILYASTKGILDIMLSTNGTALTEKMSYKLIDAGLTKISVSLDANDEEIYNKIRVGGDFKKVIQNCLTFLKVRESLNKKIPLFKVTFVKKIPYAFEYL